MALEDFENFKSDKFMEIVDVGLFEGYYTAFGKVKGSMDGGLVLPIIQSSGVNVSPNFNIKTTDLQEGYKNFKSNNDDTITFKVDVIIKDDAKWGQVFRSNHLEYDGFYYPTDMRVTRWLDIWMRNMKPLYVVSDAIDVPNGVYLITKNSGRKQTYKQYTVWTLEFTTFKQLEVFKYVNDNAVVQAAIDALTPKPTTTSTKSSSTSSKTLKSCSASEIKYSSTKNYTECNKLLQEKLYKLGYLRKDQIDGWYGPVTMEAVKKFQRAWNNKGGSLLVDGICGKVTLSKIITW